MADRDLERQRQPEVEKNDPIPRSPVEEEEHEEAIASPETETSPEADEKPSPFDSRRHSYEYARHPDPLRPPTIRRTTSRHDSLAKTLTRLRSRRPGAEREFTHPLIQQKTTADVLVDFDGKDDPYRPINWPFRKKVIHTALYGFTTFGITFASSVYSAGIGQIAHDFNVGTEVSTLGISLMLLGFGLGPLIWAPLSELYGRKAAVLTVS